MQHSYATLTLNDQMLAALNSLGGKTTFFFLTHVIIEKICREEHQQVAVYELAQSQVLYRHAHILSSKIKLYNTYNHGTQGDIRYLRALQQTHRGAVTRL